jgi:copper chaperone NosL
VSVSRLAWASVALLLLAAVVTAQEPSRRPSPKDKCPVCGMFVSKYPDWTAAVAFQDGSLAWFDGAKDLFKFLADPGRFMPGRRATDVRVVTVNDYYGVKPIDAKEAYFVIGSDVFGPMGKELVPFGKKTEAEEFLRDHRGQRILRFGEVNRAVLDGLE